MRRRQWLEYKEYEGICMEYVGYDKGSSCVKWLKSTTCSGRPCTKKGQPHVDVNGPKIW